MGGRRGTDQPADRSELRLENQRLGPAQRHGPPSQPFEEGTDVLLEPSGRYDRRRIEEGHVVGDDLCPSFNGSSTTLAASESPATAGGCRPSLLGRPQSGGLQQSDSHNRGPDIGDYRRGVRGCLGAHHSTNDHPARNVESGSPAGRVLDGDSSARTGRNAHGPKASAARRARRPQRPRHRRPWPLARRHRW